MKTDKSATIGISIMALVAAGGAVDATVVRLLAGEVHPFMLGFTRTLFALIAVLPLIARRPGILRTNARGAHVLRAAFKVASLVALFAALQSAPIATVTAISFASPLFVSLGAWLILSESPGPSRLFGMIVGFIGVVIILAPAMGLGQERALLLALLAAGLTATIQLMLKVMGRKDSADTLVVWNLIVSLPLVLVPALFFWSWPTPMQWGLLALQGVIGGYSQFGVTRALQMADVSLIAPVEFLRLPFAAAAGWIFFAEIPRFESWVGALFIFASILLLAMSSGSRRVRGEG